MMLADQALTASTPEKVVGEAKRRNRKRTKRATDLRCLNATARERQEAWLATDQANLTTRLTHDLEVGYAALRTDRATDPLPESWDEVGVEGTGLERLPFYGRAAGLGD